MSRQLFRGINDIATHSQDKMFGSLDSELQKGIDICDTIDTAIDTLCKISATYGNWRIPLHKMCTEVKTFFHYEFSDHVEIGTTSHCKEHCAEFASSGRPSVINI